MRKILPNSYEPIFMCELADNLQYFTTGEIAELMSITDRKSNDESFYTRVPILKPEEIEKLNSLYFKIDSKESKTSAKSSLRTTGDQILDREEKSSRKYKSELEVLFPSNTDQKVQRKSNANMKTRNKSELIGRPTFRKCYEMIQQPRSSHILLEKQQQSAMVCCTIFSSSKSMRSNPFMIARAEMSNK